MRAKHWLIVVGIFFLLVITSIFACAYEIANCDGFVCVI